LHAAVFALSEAPAASDQSNDRIVGQRRPPQDTFQIYSDKFQAISLLYRSLRQIKRQNTLSVVHHRHRVVDRKTQTDSVHWLNAGPCPAASCLLWQFPQAMFVINVGET